MFGQFESRALEALTQAQELARERGETSLDVHHLLIGALDADTHLAAALHTPPATLAAALPKRSDPPVPEGQELPFSPDALAVMDVVALKAQEGGRIGCRELVAAILNDPSELIREALAAVDLNTDQLRARLQRG